MASEASGWIVLAHLVRPQGRKGELLAELYTDFPESLTGRADMFLIPEGFSGELATAKRAEVVSSWLPVGKNRGRVVLGLAGIDSISAAEQFAGLDLVVPEDRRLPLEDDSTYVSDLVGCIVFDGDIEVGPVADVQFPAASDGSRLSDGIPLLVVQADEETLIPFAKAFVRTFDLEGRRIVMELPAGLIEINRQN